MVQGPDLGNTDNTEVFPAVLVHTDNLLYFTAAKGFRAGGVNQVLTSAAKAHWPSTDSPQPSCRRPMIRIPSGATSRRQASVYSTDAPKSTRPSTISNEQRADVPVPRRWRRLRCSLRAQPRRRSRGEIRPIPVAHPQCRGQPHQGRVHTSLVIPGGPATRAGDLVVAQMDRSLPNRQGRWISGPGSTLRSVRSRPMPAWTIGGTTAIHRSPKQWRVLARLQRRPGAEQPQPARRLRARGIRGEPVRLNVTDEDTGARSVGLAVHQRRLQHLQQLHLWRYRGGTVTAANRHPARLPALRGTVASTSVLLRGTLPGSLLTRRHLLPGTRAHRDAVRDRVPSRAYGWPN